MRLFGCSVWTSVVPFFPANFQNAFKNRCFLRVLTYFCDSKTWVTNCSFLRSTGFPYFTRILIIFLKITVVSLSFQETADQYV